MSWNFHRLFTEVIDTKNGRESALNWFISKGILPAIMICDECGSEMRCYLNEGTYGLFRCRRISKHAGKNKDIQVSRAKGTLFESYTLRPDRVILLMFCFACGMGFDQTMKQLSYQNNVSGTTIVNYFHHFRQVICESMLLSSEEDSSILGGNEAVVEIFHAKFKQKKFKSVRITGGLRIFGMFDLGSKQCRVIPCPDGKNDAETLMPLIRKSIAAGTIILTEEWQEYSVADRSKSYQFVNSVSRNPHTGKSLNQKVVSSWQPLRKYFPSEDMADSILEHLFRYRCEETKCHVFDELVSAMKMVYPVKEAFKVESTESKNSSILDPANHMSSSQLGLDKPKVELMESKDSPMMVSTNFMSSTELHPKKPKVEPMESKVYPVMVSKHYVLLRATPFLRATPILRATPK